MSPTKSAEIAIDMKDVGMRYGNGPEVLKDINLSIPSGSMHFLTGESGAGKTSLLSLMYLANRPIRGKMQIFNDDLDYMDKNKLALTRRRIGVTFQNYMLLDHLTILDNVALPLKIAGKSNKYIHEHVPELLEWIGLGKHIYSKPPILSGGQKQRVAIARAVINKPDIILADEPTGNVDEEMALKLLYLFVELNKRGAAVIIATHSNLLINQLKIPVLHLHKGKLIK
jgi:cell division transport system ATP-binding protein